MKTGFEPAYIITYSKSNSYVRDQKPTHPVRPQDRIATLPFEETTYATFFRGENHNKSTATTLGWGLVIK